MIFLKLSLRIGKAAAVKFLLEHGANVNAKNGKSKTPLQYSAYNGIKKEIQEKLFNSNKFVLKFRLHGRGQAFNSTWCRS